MARKKKQKTYSASAIRLRALRHLAGRGGHSEQRLFAEEFLGLTQKTYSGYENNTAVARWNAETIADKTNVTPDWIQRGNTQGLSIKQVRELEEAEAFVRRALGIA